MSETPKISEFGRVASIGLEDYIEGLKAELDRDGSDKAAVKAELNRVGKPAKETAVAPSAPEKA